MVQEKKIRTVNPANGQVLAEYDNMTNEEIKNVIHKSKNAFEEWKKDIGKRSIFLHKLSAQLRKDREKLATIATQEMGKPIKESRLEIDKCAWAVEFYAYNGELYLSGEPLNSDAIKTMISYQPLGIIGSIMPWNFPYWQALRFAAPSLMAGNTIVLKPASATMQCGIEIERIFEEVGLPRGVFQTAVGDSRVAEFLIESESTNAVTFTGSVPVGSKVAQRATGHLKKTVLELGGSDPFIVCEDADIEKASTGAVKG